MLATKMSQTKSSGAPEDEVILSDELRVPAHTENPVSDKNGVVSSPEEVAMDLDPAVHELLRVPDDPMPHAQEAPLTHTVDSLSPGSRDESPEAQILTVDANVRALDEGQEEMQTDFDKRAASSEIDFAQIISSRSWRQDAEIIIPNNTVLPQAMPPPLGKSNEAFVPDSNHQILHSPFGINSNHQFQYNHRTHRTSTSFASISNFGSPASFMSASTPGSYMTAKSNFNSPAFHDYAIPADGQQKLGIIPEFWPEKLKPPTPIGPLGRISKGYHSYLIEKELIPPPDTEINWSGKGQHVEFSSTEEVPVHVLSHLGSSISATVDKVQCKRIILARKMMRCTRNWKAADALREVEHLHKLRHFHIVQLVGSYLQGRTFSILMYPAADYHLGTFLEDTIDGIDMFQVGRKEFLASILNCLSSAVAYIHANTTKHMDIKPANILVRQLKNQIGHSVIDDPVWRVYLADFGLSTSFAPQDHSQTDKPTARTAKYCAPEVYDYESHGRSADIFSLGCVFLEILSVMCEKSPHEFEEFRSTENEDDESFRGNLSKVLEWINFVLLPRGYGLYVLMLSYAQLSKILDEITPMLQRDPKGRPSAHEVCNLFSSLDLEGTPFAQNTCCSRPPESYVAA